MLKQFYREVKFAFLENKLAIYLSLIILILSLISGYIFESYFSSYLQPAVDDLIQKVETGVVQLTFKDIFLNNIAIIFQMFIYGLLFCLSVFLLAYNGFFVGYYVAIQDDFFRVVLMLLPHGIFELTSCFLACSSGLVLFNFLFNFFKSYLIADLSLLDSFHDNIIKLKQAVLIFFISVILMIIAGFVEVYLTVPIARFVLGFFS